MEQLILGDVLRDEGMRRAADHADRKVPSWQEMALDYLVDYSKAFNEFLVEDVREWAHDHGLPEPPSARAWGAVISTAKRKNLVEFVKYRRVKNPKAHSTTAAVWRKY